MSTKRFSFLLLDANVVIELFGCGLWDVVVAACDIHVGRTVIRESAFFETDDGRREQIDLGPYVKDGRIKTFDVDTADIDAFIDRFDVSYVEKLDPGETEALAKLGSMPQETKICSADKIVFKVLACLGKDDQGISLEEVLSGIGRGRKLSWPHTKKFRESCCSEGHVDAIQNRGLKTE